MTKTAAKRNTPKKANMIEIVEDGVLDDDVVMEQIYDSDELNSSDPDCQIVIRHQSMKSLGWRTYTKTKS
jgi:hypothetical protein